MMRQLFTLLALITGLAVTAMPLEARAQVPHRAQMQLAVECAALVATAQRTPYSAPLPALRPVPIMAEPLALVPHGFASALRIGIDLAHE